VLGQGAERAGHGERGTHAVGEVHVAALHVHERVLAGHEALALAGARGERLLRLADRARGGGASRGAPRHGDARRLRGSLPLGGARVDRGARGGGRGLGRRERVSHAGELLVGAARSHLADRLLVALRPRIELLPPRGEAGHLAGRSHAGFVGPLRCGARRLQRRTRFTVRVVRRLEAPLREVGLGTHLRECALGGRRRFPGAGGLGGGRVPFGALLFLVRVELAEPRGVFLGLALLVELRALFDPPLGLQLVEAVPHPTGLRLGDLVELPPLGQLLFVPGDRPLRFFQLHVRGAQPLQERFPIGGERAETREREVQLLLAEPRAEMLRPERPLHLALSAFQLPTEAVVQVGHLVERLPRLPEPFERLLAALFVTTDPGGLLDEASALHRPRVHDLPDAALLDEGVEAVSDAGVEEEVGDVAEAHLLGVDAVLARAIAVEPATDLQLGETLPGAGEGLLARHEGEGDLREAEALPRGAAGEDDVAHRVAPQRPGRLLADAPAHRIDDVALAAPVRPDHARDPRAEVQDGPIGEGLEALQFELPDPHAEPPRGGRVYRGAPPGGGLLRGRVPVRGRRKGGGHQGLVSAVGDPSSRSSAIATTMSASTFTPLRTRASTQSTGTMSGIATATIASGMPAAVSTRGRITSPASGMPAIPTPAMIEARTIVNCWLASSGKPSAWHRKSVAIAS
jgi:hypothetical protein